MEDIIKVVNGATATTVKVNNGENDENPRALKVSRLKTLLSNGHSFLLLVASCLATLTVAG